MAGTRLRALAATVTLPRVNQMLTAAALLLGIWCVVSPLIMQPRVDRLIARAKQRVTPFIVAPPLEGLRPSDEYLQAMRHQDPFRLGEHAPNAVQGAGPGPMAAPDAKTQLAELRLVGISWGTDPLAMIEQHSDQQTHVLRRGDVIGPFTVKEILQDRVILRAGSQEMELF